MNTILTIECVRPSEIPGVTLWGQKIKPHLEVNELISLTWRYRLIPLPGSAMYYLMDANGAESLVDVLFNEMITNDPVAYLHCLMQDAIERKKYAYSEHDAHFIVHLVVNEKYDSDECEVWRVLGVLDLSKMVTA